MSQSGGGALPKGWSIATIDDILCPLDDGRTLHHGWSPQCDKEPATSNEEWGVLKTTAIQPGAFLPEHNKRLPDHLSPRPQHEVRAGDFLITCAGPRVRCGVPSLVRYTRPRLMLSGKMYRFRVSDVHFDASYLEKYLLSGKAQMAIDRMKTGGSESGLNLTHDRFRRLEIPVAPLNEQRRIASKIDELFSELEEGERALGRMQKLVERYRQSVLKAAVTGELTREWRRRQKGQIESGAALLQRVLNARRAAWERETLLQMRASGSIPKSNNWKQKYPEPVPPDTTELPELPPGWTWASIDQVGFVSGGLTKNQKRNECELRRPFLRVANVYANRLDLAEVHEIGLSGGELNRVLLKRGDLLVVEGNGSVEQIGRVALWDGSIESCVHQNHLIKVRCTEVLPSWYALIWCMSPHGREQIRRVASSTSGLHTLSISKVRALPVPIPTGAELQVIQDRFQEMESVVTQQVETISRQRTRATGLRQAILRLAFAGGLMPQDPADEPARTLLERIADDRTPRCVDAAKRRRAKTKAA